MKIEALLHNLWLVVEFMSGFALVLATATYTTDEVHPAITSTAVTIVLMGSFTRLFNRYWVFTGMMKMGVVLLPLTFIAMTIGFVRAERWDYLIMLIIMYAPAFAMGGLLISGKESLANFLWYIVVRHQPDGYRPDLDDRPHRAYQHYMPPSGLWPKPKSGVAIYAWAIRLRLNAEIGEVIRAGNIYYFRLVGAFRDISDEMIFDIARTVERECWYANGWIGVSHEAN